MNCLNKIARMRHLKLIYTNIMKHIQDIGDSIDDTTIAKTGRLTSSYTIIDDINACIKRSNILEFAIDITIDSASVGTVVAVLPEGFHPLNNYQITCFGLTGNRYLDIYKTGELVIQGSDISENTTLRIHSICIAK